MSIETDNLNSADPDLLALVMLLRFHGVGAARRTMGGTLCRSKGQELVYAARISLDRTQMQVDDNLVNLTPGMAVTVEIKTGARTVISYLLSPLMRYKQESLRER